MSKLLDNVNVHFDLTRDDTPDLRTLGFVVGTAKILMQYIHFAVDAGKKLYYYNDGCYRKYGEDLVKEAVQMLVTGSSVESEWNIRKLADVVEYIRIAAPALWDVPNTRYINVLNGLYDTAADELVDHTSEHLSSIQLPVTYNKRAKCPKWDKFVAEVFPNDSTNLVWEILAMLVVPNSHIHKALFLSGSGRNGKSTLLRAMTKFLGTENVSTLNLHQIEENQFARSSLLGKLANVCPDISNRKLTSTNYFKAITGGDIVSMEYKYGDMFEVKPFCKLIFSANDLPRSGDTSEGFYNRLIIVPFEATFDDNPAIGDRLDKELITPSELSGVLNRVLEVLPNVRENGLTYTPSMKQTLNDYRNLTDPLELTISDLLIDYPANWVSKERLLSKVNLYLRETYRIVQPISQNRLGKAIRRRFPHVTDQYVRENGARQIGYRGIACAGINLRPSKVIPSSLIVVE